ncbi:cellulose binding domain-containing protein [Microbispora sp. NEAU-D428]|uniref:cellulose binding domain-containing protein n=1 Tax=Microbispora sitophila TaxID=2771537 RepID=UPI001868DA5B|nr:cellulose binding domain-containing protein [Microbispora sitophila]MBE3015445.1 cellulose binding domain-containing protein [Microbispora sitophila]MBE3015453.1 cellulose binding domain-containing protein [Microbispora sitophila]
MQTRYVWRALAAIAALALALVAVPAEAATVKAVFSADSDWGSGYQGRYTLTNTGTAATSGWTVEFDLPAGSTVGSYWDALMTRSGDHYTFKNREYNGGLAAGASTTFGWVNSGPGKPANCRLNGGSCDGVTTSPSPSPSASPSTSPSPPPPAPGALRTAPYVDMGAWPTPSLSAMASASGLKSFTLAFVTASGCKAMWFNAYDPRQKWAKDQIDAIRAGGGDVKVSFGGATGIELAQACTDVNALVAEYDAVVTAYGLKYIDLDIEGSAAAEPASIARRSQALARLQQAHPDLKISLTLPVLPNGLTADGLNVVRSARDAGVRLDAVNVMAMDYYQSVDYGDAAVQAANSTFTQLKSLYPSLSDAQVWRMVGVTPMLGQNDDGRIYNQDDARQLVAFAKDKHLGLLAFWETTRDRNACTGALYSCTNIPQSPYEFSKIFASYTG